MFCNKPIVMVVEYSNRIWSDHITPRQMCMLLPVVFQKPFRGWNTMNGKQTKSTTKFSFDLKRAYLIESEIEWESFVIT